MLILGAGGGADVLQALASRRPHRGRRGTQPAGGRRWCRNEFGAFSGRPYSAAGRARCTSARRAASSRPATAPLRSDPGRSAGRVLGRRRPACTAWRRAISTPSKRCRPTCDHLRPGGLLAITRWVTLPPRDTPQAVRDGGRGPGSRRACRPPALGWLMIRGWKTATLLVKNGPFTPGQDRGAARRSARRAPSMPVWYPGHAASSGRTATTSWTGRISAKARRRCSSDAAGRFRRALQIRPSAPATDDRPYFFHFFRWDALPEILALKNRGGLSLLEWGYPVVIATLAQALIAGFALIAPAAAGCSCGGNRSRARRPTRRGVALYFTRPGPGLHVRGNRLHPEIHSVPQPSRVCRRRWC
ncbi:MAG: hypothetical protein MZV65_48765 [Chromatiales bacterium]|nr:hypothetical protein [Chromatiales bacterium]